jgi:hypothetical protein
MAVVTSIFTGVHSKNYTRTTPKYNDGNPDDTTSSVVITFALFAILLIIVMFSYLMCKWYIHRRQKHIRQSIRPRNISSVYVISNIVPDVIEEPPPSYYSVVQTREGQSVSTPHS